MGYMGMGKSGKSGRQTGRAAEAARTKRSGTSEGELANSTERRKNNKISFIEGTPTANVIVVHRPCPCLPSPISHSPPEFPIHPIQKKNPSPCIFPRLRPEIKAQDDELHLASPAKRGERHSTGQRGIENCNFD